MRAEHFQSLLHVERLVRPELANGALLIKELNGEIKLYNVYDMKISACIDCKYCFKNQGCSIKDDMEPFYADMEDAGAFIIASPMHFGIVSAPLFTLATKLQQIGRAHV